MLRAKADAADHTTISWVTLHAGVRNCLIRRIPFAALLPVLITASVANAAHIPRRIVSLSPDLTEIMYGVGALNRIVGVSNYDTYPPEVAKLPHLGQLDVTNYEKLTGLRPDLVLITASQAPFQEDTLTQLGLRVLKISNRTVQEIYDAMMTIGRAVGNESEAAQLVTRTREGLARVANRTAKLPKPRVVLIIDRTPGTLRDLYAATEGSYLSDLIAIAGGQVAMKPVPSGYTKVQKEDLLATNPDVILDFIQGPGSRFAGNPLEPWQEMPELKAVRARRVHEVNEDFVPHASQRVVLTAELFAKLIHPEAK